MANLDKLILYTDGASLGNPGRAGIGIIICNQNRDVIRRMTEFIGINTNNVAEYMALIYALQEALYLKAKELSCFLDSELVVKQLEGSYKVKDSKLKPLYYQIKHLENFFQKVSFNYISRDRNKEADKLAKEAAKKKRG
ncbi:ribonuclease H [Candidatus Aerophobetes bacterium Ae_b3a]|nr:MAG: ribonuclease H [Candidatus Aerophobetes bacterium Ae_b3a]